MESEFKSAATPRCTDVTFDLSLCQLHVSHQLVVEKKVDRGLLPPKKMLGKNSKSLVERRQKELELYLQTLLQQFPQGTPTTLAAFLHFHLYVSTPNGAQLKSEPFNSVLNQA